MEGENYSKTNQVNAADGDHAPGPGSTEAKGAGLFQAICAISTSIDAAMSFAMVVDLMGFGLRGLDNEYGEATLAVAEMLQRHLRDAKAGCNLILGEGPPLPRHKPCNAGDSPPKADT
jgi:hypothetical protein